MTEPASFNHLDTWLPDKIRDCGLTVQEFADQAGLSRSALYHFMKDKRRPDDRTISKICKFLNLPIEEGKAQYTRNMPGRPKGYERIQQTAEVVSAENI